MKTGGLWIRGGNVVVVINSGIVLCFYLANAVHIEAKESHSFLFCHQISQEHGHRPRVRLDRSNLNQFDRHFYRRGKGVTLLYCTGYNNAEGAEVARKGYSGGGAELL